MATTDEQACLANIGLAEGLRIRARYQEGLECLFDAEAAAEAIGSAEFLSRIHGLKGNFYFPLGDVNLCMAEHEKVLHYEFKFRNVLTALVCKFVDQDLVNRLKDAIKKWC